MVHTMHIFFAHYIAQLGWIIYPLIAILIFLEGEGVIYSVMFLSYHGTLNIYAAVATICLTVILTDMSSYAIGYYGTQKFPRIARFYERIMHPFDHRLNRISFTFFLISKFTYGLHRAVVIRSGMLRIPLKKFIRIDIITSALWILVIAGLAYGSWRSVHYLHRSLRYAEIGLGIGVLILLVSSHVISYFSKKKLLANKQ